MKAFFLSGVLFPLLLTCTILEAADPAKIQVDFSRSGPPLALRLNMGSNGWTNPWMSKYFEDIGVEYRRMDHWNNAYGEVMRKPDGTLAYDFAPLDQAVRAATGGFAFKAYPTVDYSPACLTTELLQNPLIFQPAGLLGRMTPAGTLLLAALSIHDPGAPERRAGKAADSGLYEIDCKGIVLRQWPYSGDFLVSPDNHIFINREGSCTVLDAARKEIGKIEGRVVQVTSDGHLLVRRGDKLLLCDTGGKSSQEWAVPDDRYPSLLTAGGLLQASASGVKLLAASGTRSVLEFPQKVNGPNLMLASNSTGRIFVALTAGKAIQIQAFDPQGTTLWKAEDMPSGAGRGLFATADGRVLVVANSFVQELTAEGQPGWKISVWDGQKASLAKSEGMETLVLRDSGGTVFEFDTRTGETLWSYGNLGDKSAWAITPPKEMTEWEDVVANLVKHYRKDMGLDWDRWEMWNEPTANGFFWKGTAEDYARAYEATMRGVERSDPTIHMDAFAGKWGAEIVQYFNDKKVRLDGLTQHGYLVMSRDKDMAAREREMIGELAAVAHQYKGGKPPSTGDSEWNTHPGHGGAQPDLYENGSFRAAFQSEMIEIKRKAGETFSSLFSMNSSTESPSGWVLYSETPVGGKNPEQGKKLAYVTPAYNAAKLWAMLPGVEAPAKVEFHAQEAGGSKAVIDGAASGDAASGEYGCLVWNFSNQSPAAADQNVTLNFNFPPGTGPLTFHHYVIDKDHSNFMAGWDKQWLQAVESGQKPASELATWNVVLQKDSVHAFFFSKRPLHAAVAQSEITVLVHHPVRFDASPGTGIPGSYRWNTGESGELNFPPPDDAETGSILYGPKPVFLKGYDKPGTYTATLQVATDAYQTETDRATVKVNAVEEKTAPDAPADLNASCAGTATDCYLSWSAPNYAKNPDLAGYNIYRKEGEGGWKRITEKPAPPSFCFTDQTLSPGGTYLFRVAAVDSSGNESAPSNEVAARPVAIKTKPKAPVEFAAKILQGDLVQLSWKNSSLVAAARVTGFNIYRRTVGAMDFQKLNSTPVPYQRYYDDVQNTGLASRSEYCVTSVDRYGNESQQSDAIVPAATP